MIDADDERPRRARRDGLSLHGRAEHDALVVAMHRLEAALASAAPGHELAWARRVRDDFERVHDALVRHVASSEGRDGLFDEVERARPTAAPRIGDFRRQHDELLRAADDLRGLATERDPAPDIHAIRRKTADLLFAVRHHHGKEVDLILDAFWTDIGSGD